MIFKRRPRAAQITSETELNELISSGRPVLIDFFQFGCAPCKVMDGIIDELAEEFGDSAHVVKANIARMPDALQTYKIRSTPTFVLVATSDRAKRKGKPNSRPPRPTQRWRATGLIQKDQLRRVLEREGAQRAV